MTEIVAAIYSRLASDVSGGSFHSLLGGRYYHLEGPQNVAFPNCAFSLDSVENMDQFGGSRVLQGSVGFDIYCEAKAGAASAMAIEEALFKLLDQQVLSPSGSIYGQVNLQCMARGVPSVGDEFIVISTSYSLFSTRVA